MTSVSKVLRIDIIASSSYFFIKVIEIWGVMCIRGGGFALDTKSYVCSGVMSEFSILHHRNQHQTMIRTLVSEVFIQTSIITSYHLV